MNNKPTIFVTNDDGFEAKGFEAVVEVASHFGNVIGVAPMVTQSAKSQAITLFEPLRLNLIKKSENIELYALSGTPVDCLKFGFDYLFHDRKIDIVISGINHGSNAAVNVMYSGTMGAAIEATFYGVPSVGLSLTNHSADADFSAAIHYGKIVIERVFEKLEQFKGLCLNVNVPNIPLTDIKGFKICRQTRSLWIEEFIKRTDPFGKDYFWVNGSITNIEPHATDSDEWALKNGYVAVVPVQVDMTDYKNIDKVTTIF